MRKARNIQDLMTILGFEVGGGRGGDFAIVSRRQNMRDFYFARIPWLSFFLLPSAKKNISQEKKIITKNEVIIQRKHLYPYNTIL